MDDKAKSMTQEENHDNFLNFVIEKEDIDNLMLDQDLEKEKFGMISPDSPKYIPTSAIDNRMKRWESKDFQVYLHNYLKQQYKKTDVKITKKFSEKVYRKMYDANIYKNPKQATYMKVMWHPEVTRADYDYISTILGKEGRYLLYNQISVMGSLMFVYYKTNVGSKYFRNKMASTMALFGVVPLASAAATHFYFMHYVTQRIKSLGLIDKYQIK
jgi:hypothetical protein